jgi:hypothetical protein
MRPRDTSERAAAVQSDLQDSIGPEERVSLAVKASDFAREFAKAALRQRHPTFTEDQIARELIQQLYGPIKARL